MKSITLLFILFNTYILSVAQSYCGTELSSLAKEQILRLPQQDIRTYNRESPIVRLALHRIAQDNGTGGFTWAEIHDWVATLPDAFGEHDICFSIFSEDEIHDDDFFNLTSFSGAIWEAMIVTNLKFNAINIYFVEVK